MKHFTLYSVFAFFVTLTCVARPALAQQLPLVNTRFVGTYGRDAIGGLVYDPRDKSVLVCGYADSCGNGDFPQCPAALQSAQQKGALTIGKLSTSGNLLWTRMYGSSSFAAGSDIAIPAGKDGYVVAGNAYGNDGDVSGNHGTGLNNADFWLLRLDGNGNKLWQRCFGGIYDDRPYGCIPTSDGGYLVAGVTNSPTSGDVPSSYASSQSTYDWLVVKVDSGGNKQWSKTIGGTGYEDYCRIFEWGGAYYLTGGSYSSDHECSDGSWKAGNTGQDFFLIKLDLAGNSLWSKSYGSFAEDYFTDAVFDRRDTTFVLTGITASTGDHFVPAGPGLNVNRVWALKLALDGTVRWTKVMGETAPQARLELHYGVALALRPQPGGYGLVAGVLPAGTAAIPGYLGGEDAHVFLIDGSGDPVIDKVIGGTGYESFPRIAAWGKTVVVGGHTALSQQFTEGTQLSGPHGPFDDLYLSFLDYWPLGVDHSSADKGNVLKFYPIPATDNVTVAPPSGSNGIGRLCIRSANGMIYYQHSVAIEPKTYTISTVGWPRGIYVAEWTDTSGHRYNQKLLLQ